MSLLLWLLLPVAAASGWWAAAHRQQTRRRANRARFNSAYGQGLNYLLNEQPDKAVEVLLQLVEVDPDTVELHLALGSLFRRRGEVARAIRVHQNIAARGGLSQELRNQARLELGRDYLKAGLLDRAEHLFRRLSAEGAHERQACQYLVDIYQQEKEWSRAIEVARRIAGSDPAHWQIRIAHYHCELGEAALARGDVGEARVRAEHARCEDAECVRALLLRAAACQHAGDFQTAIETYQSLGEQSRRLLPDIQQQLQACYDLSGQARRHPDASAVETGAFETRFRCEQCGFSSRKLFWQCPGCKSWSSVKPLGQGAPL